MDFHLTKEQEMVRKMYREFAETEVKPLAEEIDISSVSFLPHMELLRSLLCELW